MPRLGLFALLIAMHGLPVAQAAQQRTDTLRARIAALKAELPGIDATGIPVRRIEARIALAELVNAREAIGYLSAAVLLADSAGDAEARLEARAKLMERYRAAGDPRRALMEAVRILELQRLLAEADSARHAREVAELSLAAGQERDSLRIAHEAELSAIKDALAQALDRSATKEAMLVGAAVLVVALMVAILLMRRRQRRFKARQVADLEALHAQLKELATVVEGLSRAVDKPSPSATLAEAGLDAGASVIVSTPEPALDPMVLALFKRQAPERMATLQAARAADDYEKVLRVLHSLRPQLDALDPAGLGALGAQLRAMQPGDPSWQSGLDALMERIAALLARQ